jgi:hypothetical protein
MGLLSAVARVASKNLSKLSDDGMKGSVVSGVPNYIPGYYGPTEAAKEAGTSAILQEKIGGFAGVVGEGIKNAAKMQMPYNRAVYRDTGVNRPLMQSPKQTPANRTMQEEVTARALANRHISEQSGRKGPNVLDEVLERSAYTDYIPMEKGFYGVANKFNKGTAKQKITKDESAKLEDYMARVWNTKTLMDRFKGKPGEKLGFKRNNKFVLKRPQGTISGNHWNDMVNRSVFSNVARDVFGKKMKDPKSVDELADRLKKVKWTEVDKKGVKHKRVGVPGIEKDTDGVWFSFSKAGSAITEGGVNFRVKIKPDGNGFGVMSDEHNFLEVLPGMSTALPNKVLAATPPMHFNIKKTRPMQTGGAKPKRGRPAKPNKYVNKSWQEFGPEGNQNLDEFLNTIKPSDSTLRKERLKALGKGGMLGLGASALYSHE